MTNRASRLYSFVFGLVCLITLTPASAECEGTEIGYELTFGGWTFESLGKDSDGDNVFRIVKDGTIAMLFSEPDGDLMFRSYFDEDHRLSDLNEINKNFRYVTAYRDDDDDIVFDFHILSWDDTCPENISETLRLFFRMIDRAATVLAER